MGSTKFWILKILIRLVLWSNNFVKHFIQFNFTCLPAATTIFMVTAANTWPTSIPSSLAKNWATARPLSLLLLWSKDIVDRCVSGMYRLLLECAPAAWQARGGWAWSPPPRSVQSSRWYAAVGHALCTEERHLGDGYTRTSGQYKWVSWLATELEEARLKD